MQCSMKVQGHSYVKSRSVTVTVTLLAEYKDYIMTFEVILVLDDKIVLHCKNKFVQFYNVNKCFICRANKHFQDTVSFASVNLI